MPPRRTNSSDPDPTRAQASGLEAGIRQALARLLAACRPGLEPRLTGALLLTQRRAPYLAVLRLVLRCVVLRFAELRHASLPGLDSTGALARAVDPSGEGGAWSRLITHFRDVHAAIAADLEADVPTLFSPPRSSSPDPVELVLEILDDPAFPMSDAAVRSLVETVCHAIPERSLPQRPDPLAGDPGSDAWWPPCEALGALYEALLGASVDDLELESRPGRHLPPAHAARKGAGAFYTPSNLIEPLVERTLAPLCARSEGRIPGGAAILELKVCDPAMGAGAFLLGALRYLSARAQERAPGRLASLRTHVAERCLHGVDLDPIAADLARWSVWLEAGGEPSLLARLSRNIRCGDALVGAWRDQVDRYPDRAWERDGGDDGHRGVHFTGGSWSRSLARQRAGSRGHEAPAPTASSLGTAVRSQFDTWCALWFWPPDQLELAPTHTLHNLPAEAEVLVRSIAQKHRFFHWELEFPQIFAGDAPGFDAVLGNPPWEIRKPSSLEFFSALDPVYRGLSKQAALERQQQLFQDPAVERAWLEACARCKAFSHWCRKVALPNSADGDGSTSQPLLTDRSSTGDSFPTDRSSSRSALPTDRSDRPFRRQHGGDLNSYKLFLEQAFHLLRPGGRLGLVVPSGLYTDKGCAGLRDMLLSEARWEWLFGFENRQSLFPIHRSYKFAVVIAQKGGQTDAVRVAFMQRSLDAWRGPAPPTLTYTREQVQRFSPHSQVMLELSHPRDAGVLERLYDGSALLGDRTPAGWSLEYARELDMTLDSRRFPPRTRWEASGYVADEYGRWLRGGWAPWLGSRSSIERPAASILSATGDRAIRIGDIEGGALPLIEGRMIGQLDFSQKGWVRGAGRTAVWRSIPWDDKRLEPQFLLGFEDFHRVSPDGGRAIPPGLKVGFMAVGSATNVRSMIATPIFDLPCGNAVPVLRSGPGLFADLALAACLNSFVYDYALRTRLGGVNLNYFVLEETPLPRWETPCASARDLAWNAIARACLRLALCHPRFAPIWVDAGEAGSWERSWALTPHERLRLRCQIDALVAELYGLDYDDLAWILRDCHHTPRARAGLAGDPKSFARVDQERPPVLRHTVLTLAAFQALKRDGLKNFLEGEGGDGWSLPATLRLSSLGLEGPHTAEIRPVAAALGPRYMEWQTGLEAGRCRESCRTHAERLALSCSSLT